MKIKVGLLFPGLSSLCIAAFTAGCTGVVVFDPKGPVGDAERFVITAAILLMMIVVVPVFVMGFWFAWRYRASNRNAAYAPKWDSSPVIDVVIWLVPLAIVTILASLTWKETFRLDPYKPIISARQPINVQAVSLDWKWLFIYPDHDIAVVNHLVFPAGVPLSFRITSETVMTSLFIPQLGSQMYGMTGMETRLNLLAREPGVYMGQNQQFSGRWFSNMSFEAEAAGAEEFTAWVQKVRSSPVTLDMARYEELIKPGAARQVTYFSSVEPGLFKRITERYVPATDTARSHRHGNHAPGGR